MKIDRSKIRSVYVRAPNWLGDVIMATAAFARIRSFFIDAKIVCGVKQGHHEILSGCRSFDDYIYVEKARGLRGLRREAAKLRPHGFDLAILFPNSISSALVCLWAGVPLRLGYTQGRRFLITHGLKAKLPKRKDGKPHGPRREPVPMVYYWGAMLDTVGMPKVEHRPILNLSATERERARELLLHYGLSPTKELILFNPGAAFGNTKLWPAEHWARLAEKLHAERGSQFLIMVGPGEERIPQGIIQEARVDMKVTANPSVTLDVLKAIVDRAALMVTTDSGPRHIAAAMRTPHVVVMGPTHPGYTNANIEDATIIRHDVECGPCHLKVCPIDHHCMTGITPDEVFAAALQRIES
ncbi:MAG: lipopolysaccharide heptosyltransferase II [Planctomycetota bacterium]|nr:MAG: lipopolysaccharide heptosyltransferase II [Planctomycetota bacterium]